MSSFQRLFCTLLYVHVAGTVDSVLIKGGVPISGVPIREVPHINNNYYNSLKLYFFCNCILVKVLVENES